MRMLNHFVRQRAEQRRAEAYRALLHHEAKIGGSLFGPISKDRRREFFCLDRHTWVWHEEWNDPDGQRRVVTTRYDVRPGGVLKSQGANTYQRLTREELLNLYQAARLYYQRIGGELQSML